MHSNIIVRPIEPGDNEPISKVIRTTLEELGLDKPGTAYFDESTDHLFDFFTTTPKSIYFIALIDNVIVGGAGVYSTEGLAKDTCEFVKMYLQKKVRGIGLGNLLIEKCMAWAREQGYQKIYLETTGIQTQAIGLYEKCGFKPLQQRLGNTGHHACHVWMLKQL